MRISQGVLPADMVSELKEAYTRSEPKTNADSRNMEPMPITSTSVSKSTCRAVTELPTRPCQPEMMPHALDRRKVDQKESNMANESEGGATNVETEGGENRE